MDDAFMSRVFEDNIEVQCADKGACEKRARYVLDFRLKKLRNQQKPNQLISNAYKSDKRTVMILYNCPFTVISNKL